MTNPQTVIKYVAINNRFKQLSDKHPDWTFKRCCQKIGNEFFLSEYTIRDILNKTDYL